MDKTELIKEIDREMGQKVAAIYNDDLAFLKDNYKFDQYLQSFVLGSSGYLSDWEAEQNTEIPLVIRGLSSSSQKAIQHCWNTGRFFYAVDTGYFSNNTKYKQWHRITKNNLQNLEPILERPDDRLKRIMDYRYQRWQQGSKILICPPSEKVMNLFDQPSPEEWTKQIIQQLQLLTDRPVEIRLKPTRGERVSTKTIEAALADDVYCLITYNSIAAVEALIYGKPAIALGPNAAQNICNTRVSEVESLKFPTRDEMMAFMCHLSYAQFTKDEMQNGTAWRIVNEGS